MRVIACLSPASADYSSPLSSPHFSQKQLLQQYEKEAIEDKARQREEELKIERDFTRIMMKKFAEDDKLEQMTQQKRRMKELQHKEEVTRRI